MDVYDDLEGPLVKNNFWADQKVELFVNKFYKFFQKIHIGFEVVFILVIFFILV